MCCPTSLAHLDIGSSSAPVELRFGNFQHWYSKSVWLTCDAQIMQVCRKVIREVGTCFSKRLLEDFWWNLFLTKLVWLENKVTSAKSQITNNVPLHWLIYCRTLILCSLFKNFTTLFITSSSPITIVVGMRSRCA